jgi:hypothetical protein
MAFDLPLTPYELERQRRIQDNERRMGERPPENPSALQLNALERRQVSKGYTSLLTNPFAPPPFARRSGVGADGRSARFL